MKDLYYENHKTLMEEIEENTNKQMKRYPMFIDWKVQYC